MNRINRYMYLVWKNPITKKEFIVGKISYNEKYTFEYCKDLGKAEMNGWTKLEPFPEEKVYESDVLFPVFSSRVPDRRRRDIDKILEKYGLPEYDAFEFLRKSGGKLPIDTYFFIDPLFIDTEDIQRDFYVAGIKSQSNCDDNGCDIPVDVAVGDELLIEENTDNECGIYNLRILTADGNLLGYVPRYYSKPISERMSKIKSYKCEIISINPRHDCSECVRVRLNMPKIK